MRLELLSTDVLQAVAAWLTREQAGLLLAPLCRAGAVFVRAVDTAEDAGTPEIWLYGPPPWLLGRVQERIERTYAEHAGGMPGLCRVLQSLALQIHNMHEDEIIELVFDRAQARARKKASVLGCHTLRVLHAPDFLWTFQAWIHRTHRQAWALHSLNRYATRESYPHTHYVVNLFKELGLRARRGRDMRFGAHPEVTPQEVLWAREYVSTSMSARGWV